MANDLDFFDDSGQLKRNRLGNHLLNRFELKTVKETGEILYYDKEEGIYKNAEALLKNYITTIVETEEDEITTYNINEILEYIRRNTYTERKKFNTKNNIILENGILELNPQIKIKKHTPDELATVKIPVKYDPKADCPRIKKFVSEIVNEEDISVVQEMIGYCLLKSYPFAKAFMLLGGGANGKSTLLSLLKKFLGRDNVATPSLQEICYNTFAKVELHNKLANIHADIPPVELKLTGNFKMLTGSDLIRGEKKHKQAFNFENYAKLIYSANELPRTKDTTKAFFRRWIIIKFPNVFEGKNKDPKQLEKITTEKEFSGLLNWSLKGLKRLLKNNCFSETKSRKEIETEWILQTDSLRAFVNRFVEEDSKRKIVKKDFYSAYSAFCDEKGISVEDSSVVGRKLPTIIPRVKSFKPEIDGERKNAWKGIKFVSTIKEYVKDVKDNQYLLGTIGKSYNNKVSSNNLDIPDIDKNQAQLALSCYPAEKPESYQHIEKRAKKKGIKPIILNKLHGEFKKKGLVISAGLTEDKTNELWYLAGKRK